MRHDNPPAFPRPASIDPSSGTLPDGDVLLGGQVGMTLRDYFAAHALASSFIDCPKSSGPVQLARRAYLIADAMLLARADEGWPGA